MKQFFDEITEKYEFKIPAEQFSPLILAYIGDAVFELLTRSIVCSDGNAPVNKLNARSRQIVNASSQSEMFEKVKDCLSSQEFAVMKRGRNAKSFTSAKNAAINDYRRATGLEALFGYLFIKGSYGRIMEIFNICIG